MLYSLLASSRINETLPVIWACSCLSAVNSRDCFFSCHSALSIRRSAKHRWRDQNTRRLQTQEEPMLHVPQEGRPDRWAQPACSHTPQLRCNLYTFWRADVCFVRVRLPLWESLLWTPSLLGQAQLPLRLQGGGCGQDPQREPGSGGR